MKWTNAIAITFIYLLGFLIVQTHLLSYGISEISPLQIYYILVGALLIITLLPSILIVIQIELWMYKSLDTKANMVLTGLVFLGVSLIVLSVIKFNTFQFILNMRSYPYPRQYPLINVLSANGVILCLYCILWSIKALGGSPILLRVSKVVALTMFFSWYPIFFGRTIYPALDQGSLGGAPQFAEIKAENISAPCLLIHRSATGIYFIPLSQIPNDLEQSSPFHQYTTIANSPVRQAVLNNQVSFIPMSKLEEVKIFGLKHPGAELKPIQ